MSVNAVLHPDPYSYKYTFNLVGNTDTVRFTLALKPETRCKGVKVQIESFDLMYMLRTYNYMQMAS